MFHAARLEPIYATMRNRQAWPKEVRFPESEGNRLRAGHSPKPAAKKIGAAFGVTQVRLPDITPSDESQNAAARKQYDDRANFGMLRLLNRNYLTRIFAKYEHKTPSRLRKTHRVRASRRRRVLHSPVQKKHRLMAGPPPTRRPGQLPEAITNSYALIWKCSATSPRIADSSISTPSPGSFGTTICPFSRRKETFA